MNPIYLDYNATTPIDRGVADAMKPFLYDHFGNPSSMHRYGTTTKQAIIEARKQLASLIGCKPGEVIFTSGGTESNNYALKGAAMALKVKGNHIITSTIEHPAITEVCRFLEKNGFRITYIPVDEYGIVDVGALELAIGPETILISIMHANNEVGSIQPLSQISKLAKENQILFHTDAAQSLGKIPVDVNDLGVDLLSVAGHKLYAPKGIGALYIRSGVRLDKMIHGADHEMDLRAGTENVLEVVGLGKACELAKKDFNKKSAHVLEMRDRLHKGILRDFPEVKLNGHPDNRLPNTLSLSFPNMEANTMLSEMELIAASAGAACHTDSIDVSSVLMAMQVPQEYAMGTIRFSTGKMTTAEEIDQAIDHIKEVIGRMKGGKIHEPILSETSIKLTSFTHGMGCACKIRPQYLEDILRDLPVPTDPNVLVSQSNSDDAAVYKINEEIALIQTVDFFTPIVDDPYTFGAIAAANAFSDIYAMGGKPTFALNIVGFPENRLPAQVLKQILKGASDKAAEAGVHILGGHTVEDTEPKFGMAVTGMLHPDRILRNDGLQVGDVLILTKPIGSGILSTAMKRGLLDQSTQKQVIDSMSRLNDRAATAMAKFPVNACTDITGFGLLGHISEMIKTNGMQLELDFESIPFFDQVEMLATENVVPGGSLNNMKYVEDIVEYHPALTNAQKIMLNDAQTSGGLLISVPESVGSDFLKHLHLSQINEATQIGRVINKGIGKIFIR